MKPAETWVFCFNVIFILNYFHFTIVILYLKTIFENRNNLKFRNYDLSSIHDKR